MYISLSIIKKLHPSEFLSSNATYCVVMGVLGGFSGFTPPPNEFVLVIKQKTHKSMTQINGKPHEIRHAPKSIMCVVSYNIKSREQIAVL